ncbi:MAG: hypothetical protein M3O78_05855 [Chloroflexota bacterium]|nr:hypothetical protein [Chloroflexota bacterium]
MTAAAGWLGRAAQAGRLAADRAELWIPGAIGSLAYIAWLPLVLVVASVPRVSDITFLGADLYSSPLYPLNVLLLALLLALLVVIACALAALSEAFLLRALGDAQPARSLGNDAGVILSILLVAGLPAAVALGAASLQLAATAPAVFTSPDIGGPLVVRVIVELAPFLLALAVALLVGQAWGAASIRRALGQPALTVRSALLAGLRDLVARPARRIGLSVVATLTDLIGAGLAFVLLRVLWNPIQRDLAGKQPFSLGSLPLLVGFVAIWLALVLAAGLLHAWVSAWWSLELSSTIVGPSAAGEEVAP